MLHQVIEIPRLELTTSLAPPAPAIATSAPVRKPDRLNFAGVCLWCGMRDCASARCIKLHARSRWMVCDECQGYAAGDCLCVHGVIEATPIRAAPRI
jgi:hypothetical protein